MQDSTSALLENPALRDPESRDQDVGSQDVGVTWGPANSIMFRFAFVYFILYIFPFPITRVPWGPFARIPLSESIYKSYIELWNAVVSWVGSQVFHVTITASLTAVETQRLITFRSAAI